MIWMQIQVLLVEGVRRIGEEETTVAILQPNTRSNIDVAKLPTFSRKARQVLGFLIAYRLYIRMKMRDIVVKEQVQ